MPKKPVIDIDVNSKQFKDFYDLFKQYQGDLDDMPKSWKEINESAMKGFNAFSAVVGALVESLSTSHKHLDSINDNLKETIDSIKDLNTATRQGDKHMASMSKHAASLAHSIFGIGKFMLKAGAWGTGLFAGATFGLDRLAKSNLQTQYTSRGLGMTMGQYRAFGTDLGRYSSPATLSAIASAKNDYQGRAMLSLATGMSQKDIMSADAGTLAGKLLQREHALWMSTPAAQRPTLAMLPQFKYLGQTTQDFYRAGAASPAEIQRAQTQYARDAQTLNIQNKSMDALYKFARQVGLAGQKIETVLTKRLAKLAPVIGTFITRLEKDAEVLINKVLTPSNLNAISSGIESFAHYLGSKDFENDVKTFARLMHDLVKVIEYVVREFKKSSPSASIKAGLNLVPGVSLLTAIPSLVRRFKHPSMAHFGPSKSAYLYSLERQNKLPSGLMAATASVESSGNPRAVSPVGAQGLMQLMPATSRQYGVQDPFNWEQSAAGGAMYYHDLLKHYHGDMNKAIAAYNWGQGNLDKSIKRYGQEWEQHIPDETRGQLLKVLSLMQKSASQRVNIAVTNKTGSNVAMSTNAAGL